MNKRGKKLSVLLTLLAVIGLSFFIGIPKAYAAGEHEFTFKFYTCDLDEEALWDQYDPDTYRVTTSAEIVCNGGLTEIAAGSKVDVGSYVVAAVHYKPGTPVDYAMQFKFNYDTDSFEPTIFHKWSRSKREYSTEFAYEIGEDLLLDYNWDSGASNPTAGRITATLMDEDGSAGDPLTDEMDLMLFYFKVLDDGEKNTDILFEFDRTYGTGIAMANKSAYVATDGVLQVKGFESPDNTLGTLTVKNGSTNYALTPTFTPGDKTNKTYTTYVPSNITSVDIAATPNEEHAIVSGTGTKTNLQYGNNSYSINVLSQSGDPETYTVNVYRINSENTLSALALSNVDFGTFSSNTTSYTATVPYTTDKTNVTATATAGNKATVTGTGNDKTLNVGSNTVSVTVSPESCKSQYSEVPGNTCTEKTYTVTVTREPASTVSTLNDLLVDGNRVPGFTPGDPTSTYTLTDVGYTKANIIISYDKGEDHETVTGDGTKTLNVGNNSFDVVVTAQDGTTKTTYTINVYRKSNNANLGTLNVTSSKTGSLDKPFNANTTTYTYNTDADETDVDITYTKADSNATVVTTPADLTNINPRTTSSVTIEVTPEDTTQAKKTYTINFAVAKSTNGNLSTITVDGDEIDNFQPGTKEYELTVPSNTESIIIGAELEDDRGEITGGTGVQTLDYGENEIEITVQPEDPNAAPVVYTVTVTREKENVSTLNDLLANGTRVKGFNPGDGTNTYTLDAVGYSTSTLNITYVKGESHETITGDGEKTLNVGNNSFDVVVTAHNGTDKTTYTINVYRKSNNANLGTLNVTSSKTGSLDKPFNANTTTYTYNTDADETDVDITYTKADSNATVVTTPADLTNINPRTTSSVTIEVTPEDTTQAKKTYTINFAIAKSTNGNLSTITVDGDEIDNFQPGTKEYEITVSSTTESIIIGAELEDDRGEITGGTGVQTLDYGENEIEITVQPEDPNAEPVVYTLTVTREYKTNADLTDLRADNVTVPNFHSGDPDGTEYNVGTVASTKTTINIAATLADPSPNGATVTGTGDISLNVGDNRLPVVVTAHDGTTKKTYYVLVKRLNSAKNLETLTITSVPTGTWDKQFDPEETTYTYTTDPDETEVIINATVPEGSGSTVVSGPGTYNPATTPEVTIVVKAEDNTEKHYIINLVRGESSNADLSDLTIDGETINGFAPNTTEYTVSVPSDTDKITIGAELADDRAELTGDGEKTLDFGPNNQFTITVTAEDGTPKVYTINVTREYKHIDTLTTLTVDGVEVPNFHSNDPDGTEYDLGKVNSDKESILIEAVLGDIDASIVGTGTKALSIGDNSFPVTITAQDGTTSRTYTIKVRRRNNDSTLTGIEVIADTQGTLSPAFQPDETEYTYTSDPDEDEITIVVTTPDGAEATIVGHPDGKVNPQDGDEDIEIIVTAEDGSITNYIIHVERGRATDATLDELGVIGYELNEEFKPEDDHYTVTVPADVDKVIITAHATDAPRAQVDGTGEVDVDFGSNPFIITVTADDNTITKPYYLTIERELSDDVKLSDLKVEGVTVENFDPDTPSYTYGPIGHDVNSLEVVATPENSHATARVTGNDNLQTGVNTITIEVEAQNGQKGYYTIEVTKEGNDDNTLSGLEVEGYTLDPEFDPTKDDDHFTVTVPSDVDSVVVNATPNDEDNATVTVEGNENLQPGENTITVTVTAENGDEKVYTITVTKEEEPEEDEKITSQIYTIADGMIKNVVYKTLPGLLKDNCDNDNDLLFVYDSEDQNEIDNNQQLGTGMIIKLIKNNRENDRDTIVVKGEVTGDGLIKINDVVKVVSHVAEVETLEGIWFEAGDFSSDGQIKINDVVAIVNIVAEE